MLIENNLYKATKYNSFTSNNNSEKKKIQYKPLIGAGIGAVSGLLLSKKAFKKENTINEVGKMLSMAGLANIGGVLGGSIGAKKEDIKAKWHEAAYQMMNISIPMLMVSSILESCKRIKILNNNPSKIIGSIVGMTSGAMIALGITNATKKDKEEKRKYTIKDSLANFDDIVATIAIGFPDFNKKVPVSKVLPFIYAYSGYRAGIIKDKSNMTNNTDKNS